jgi:hypothetical protein
MPFTVGYFIANRNGFLPDYRKFTGDYCPQVEAGWGGRPGCYARAGCGTWDRVRVDKERAKRIADGA